jgi:CHAD domain-containing protein
LPSDKPVKIRWKAGASVAENAREKLPELARDFFKTGRELAAAKPTFEALHQFRLLTKRLRYTLELFRPCYGPGLSPRIEALRTLQQRLGEISDCATTRNLILERKDLTKPQRARLLRRVKDLSAGRIVKFRRLWMNDFASTEREQWWTGYLTRFAGLRRRS